ncbi:hypothetical protein [Streptomyces flaveolus]|uniref:hypothetical protein n=1 Tax=Streptomyces flaveolus TaxID=67297 RepID=UPI003701A1AF
MPGRRTAGRTLRTLSRAGFTTYLDSGPQALLSTLARSVLPSCATAVPSRTPAGGERLRHRLAAVLP